ncbi:MAG: cyclopropane-fatty-acyl-phospholipid synthase family protein [Proteobacteria bacterium]|nr:cyclopropane-fatty-acyl-phospholipid synthase family protein [Pseudomonadota bacterium]MCH9758240.1 cyclopropane-fatty-acyl-phospholipid synthase family protein [Pseudomonadota bacterium]
MFKQYIISNFLKTLEKIEHGTLTLVMPDAKTHTFFGSAEIQATISIKNWNVVTNIIAKGDVGFAESYRDGLFETDNLANLCTLALKNAHLFDQYIYGSSIAGWISQVMYYLQSNTIKGSQRNIHAHYDLGNDFYSLWLDSTMTYSAAIFKNENESLLQAQHNKYDRIIDRLNTPAGNLLEVGCGWGGFADRATEKHDMNIKGITISNAQYNFAKRRLNKKAHLALEDYRKQNGKYDSIVSIEMFEAVGEEFWPVYFDKMKSLLKEKGKAVVQTITIDGQYFDRYRKTGDMIRTFIFPGGMLPSAEKFKAAATKADLKIVDSFDFGKDYARTLEHWLTAFEANLPKVQAMGFDDKFIRIWRFYLSTCIASFTVGRTNVIQAELVHA